MAEFSADPVGAKAFRASVFPLEKLLRLATTEEMRGMDRFAIETVGLPGRLLMENAARAVAERVSALLESTSVEGTAAGGTTGAVAVCCGAGNNGGDGYAVARLLANRGHPVTVVRLGVPVLGDARENAESWEHFGTTLDWETDSQAVGKLLDTTAVIVDALFGTGLTRAIKGKHAALIDRINAASGHAGPHPGAGIPVVAVDIPSGVNGDTGAVMGTAVHCTDTVSLQMGKPGCYQFPGAGLTGRVEVVDISIPESWGENSPGTYLLTREFASALAPNRPPAGHKGTFGHLLAICGSRGMGGAALLAGLAALKTGAGLVTAGVPGSLVDRFLASAPELMTLGDGTKDGEFFSGEQAALMLEAAESRAAAVLGCGLGRREETGAFVREITAKLGKPLLLDADSFFHLDPGQLQGRTAPTVITPHPGELSRLAKLDPAQLAADRVGHARRLAREWNLVLVLKGAATVVASPEGDAFINPTGDHGLGSAGTGDVLSGIIGSLLAQGLAPLPASLLGVYLHGLARDCQAASMTAAYFTATDLIAGIDLALRRLQEK